MKEVTQVASAALDLHRLRLPVALWNTRQNKRSVKYTLGFAQSDVIISGFVISISAFVRNVIAVLPFPRKHLPFN